MKFKKNEIYEVEEETVDSFISMFRGVWLCVVCKGKILSSDSGYYNYKIKECVRMSRKGFVLVVEEPPAANENAEGVCK